MHLWDCRFCKLRPWPSGSNLTCISNNDCLHKLQPCVRRTSIHYFMIFSLRWISINNLWQMFSKWFLMFDASCSNQMMLKIYVMVSKLQFTNLILTYYENIQLSQLLYYILKIKLCIWNRYCFLKTPKKNF